MADTAKNIESEDTDFENVKAPEGYRQVNTGGGTQRWVKASAGLKLEGWLIGRFQRRNQKKDQALQYFYQIQVTKPVAVSMKGEDGKTEEVEAAVGQTVNLDEKTSTQELSAYLDGKRWHVVIIFGKKVSLSNGHTFWPSKIFAKEAAADQVPF